MARPYLKKFIIEMHNHFNIHIYSLGMIDYIEKIIDAIIRLVGFNPFCHLIANYNYDNRIYNKKICKLYIGLSNLLIVDDRKDVWNFDKHYLYQIIPYTYADSYDCELLKLMTIILIYFNRSKNKSIFDIYEFTKIKFEII